jgi:hypothetical protein
MMNVNKIFIHFFQIIIINKIHITFILKIFIK